MTEVENAVRSQMKNARGVEMFVNSQRTAAFNKLFGLSVASAYRQPELQGLERKKEVQTNNPKPIDESKFSG